MRYISSILNLYFRYSFFSKAAWFLCALLIFTIGAAILFQNNSVLTYPVGWERSIQVSPFKVVAQNVSVDSMDDFIAVVYEGRAGGGQGVYVSLSFNAGITFLPSVKIAEAASQTVLKPVVAIAPNGTVSVVWDSYVESESTNRIFYSSSKDFGANWTAPRPLNLGKEKEMLPRLYYDERNVLHLFYHGSVDKNINIYHAESDGGDDFKTTGSLILRASMRGEFLPSICISGKNFYIVWQGMEENLTDKLFFVRSSNYGRSWTSPQLIAASTGNNEVPSVVMYDGILYVAYRNKDEKNWSIKMIKSLDEGWSWERVPLLVSTTPANCNSPTIGVAGGDLMILWYDNRSGRDKIYARKFSIKDNAFMKEDEVSEAQYESKHPVVLPKGKKFFVFWEEKNVIMAKQTDVSADPPAVYSDTNPEGKWSRFPYVDVRWKPPRDESGIAGYSIAMNKQPDFNPLPITNISANITNRRFTDVSDGVSYFHIRSVDNAGNFSRTVHYRLLISANPLPEPIIISATHQLGKPSQSHAAAFSWQVTDMERVKGFNYSLSKDTIKAPDQFTRDIKAQFNNLEEGNYFFNVAAVDKTNQTSRVSSYAFIVGSSADPDFYKRIAIQEEKFEKRQYDLGYEKGHIVQAPAVTIQFPFDTRTEYGKDSFKAVIVSSNINPGSIAGYSVYIDRERQEVSDRVNTKGPVIEVQDLHSGEYYIGVKCKYARVVNGATAYFWTKPYIARITIDIPSERSPVVYYAQRLMGKFSARFGFISLTFFGLSLVATTLGFGKRLRFYAQMLLFRIKILFRLMFRLILKKSEA